MTRDRLHLNLEIEGMYSYRSDSYDIDIRDEYVLVSKNHSRQPIFRFNIELKELFAEVLDLKSP
jgi:hypothetical protein